MTKITDIEYFADDAKLTGPFETPNGVSAQISYRPVYNPLKKSETKMGCDPNCDIHQKRRRDSGCPHFIDPSSNVIAPIDYGGTINISTGWRCRNDDPQIRRDPFDKGKGFFETKFEIDFVHDFFSLNLFTQILGRRRITNPLPPHRPAKSWGRVLGGG